MIDEDLLRRALRHEAAAERPPAEGAQAVLDRAGPVRARRLHGRRQRAVVATAVSVVVLAVAATLAGGRTTVDTAAGPPTVADEAVESRSALEARQSSGRADGSAPAPSGAVGGQAAAEVGTRGLPAFGGDARVVKTGSIELEVDGGRFGATVDRITGLATGMGGFVAETGTQESGEAPSGTVTVRVPAERFEELLTQVRRLGDVRSATSQGRDVTAEFTDLDARLRALDATRSQLLTVLGDAEDITDILAVQDRINTVQVEIEQLSGQKRLLEDQTSFATLSITLSEPGADRPLGGRRSGLGEAWARARDGFVGGLERIVAGSGPVAITVLFLAVVALVLRGAWLLVRRRLV
ncbi:MAG: DUF4349 domain-containing protein [Acidimicrobiales bacterium]